jgi:hypothetical protein
MILFGIRTTREKIAMRATPRVRLSYFIVGMTNSAPSLTPEGQREVTVLVFV